MNLSYVINKYGDIDAVCHLRCDRESCPSKVIAPMMVKQPSY